MAKSLVLRWGKFHQHCARIDERLSAEQVLSLLAYADHEYSNAQLCLQPGSCKSMPVILREEDIPTITCKMA